MKAARGARSANRNITILGGFRELNRHGAARPLISMCALTPKANVNSGSAMFAKCQ